PANAFELGGLLQVLVDFRDRLVGLRLFAGGEGDDLVQFGHDDVSGFLVVMFDGHPAEVRGSRREARGMSGPSVTARSAANHRREQTSRGAWDSRLLRW